MFKKEIISKAKAHVLRASAAVGAVKEIIALRDRKCYRCGYVKVYTVTDLGHHALFGFEHITTAQAQPFGETPAGEDIDGGAELNIADGIAA